jgi:hypothetical protein
MVTSFLIPILRKILPFFSLLIILTCPTAIALSSSSTALIHWCLKSYVTRIYIPTPKVTQAIQPSTLEKSDKLDETLDAIDNVIDGKAPLFVESLSVFAQPKLTLVHLKNIDVRSAIFGSWSVANVGGSIMGYRAQQKNPLKLFVHVEATLNGSLGEPAQALFEAIHEK